MSAGYAKLIAVIYFQEITQARSVAPRWTGLFLPNIRE